MQIADTENVYAFHARSSDNKGSAFFCFETPVSSYFVIYHKVSLYMYQGICPYYNWIRKNHVVWCSVIMRHEEGEGITNGLFVRGHRYVQSMHQGSRHEKPPGVLTLWICEKELVKGNYTFVQFNQWKFIHIWLAIFVLFVAELQIFQFCSMFFVWAVLNAALKYFSEFDRRNT
jgi:hypothetical protein